MKFLCRENGVLQNQSIIGCPMYVLSQKLKNLKVKLKLWNKEVFGNVHELVSLAENNLHLIKLQIDTDGHSDELLDQQKQAQLALDQALAKEEFFGKKKQMSDGMWKETETPVTFTE
jgi:hypothetical protein